uniref:Uncharacterized protein n=1 Tax=Anopheles quadriannulatus TaxID=34691 RepID=A0A182X640_ANOQN
TEFRITIDPNARQIESPTVHCAPDLTRTPKKNFKKRYISLRAPSTELKAVWQNLLTRQIFLVNATLGSTPMSSPLDSPDILQSFLPFTDIGTTVTSAASVKVGSLNSMQIKNQQVCPLSSIPLATYCHSNSNVSNASLHNVATNVLSGIGLSSSRKFSLSSPRNNPVDSRSYRSLTTVQNSISELPELILLHHGTHHNSINDSALHIVDRKKSDGSIDTADEKNQNYLNHVNVRGALKAVSTEEWQNSVALNTIDNLRKLPGSCNPLSTRDRILHSFSRGSRDNTRSIVEFNLSSVGRSFIDNTDESDTEVHSIAIEDDYISTPETPPPNVSPSSTIKMFDSFSNDLDIASPHEANQNSKTTEYSKFLLASGYGGSWDLLELDLDFHKVNCDPSFGNDVTEAEFLGDDDDPFGMLPTQPTPPNLLDL